MEWDGVERRGVENMHVCDPQDYITHTQHTELCDRNREWSEAKVAESKQDRDHIRTTVAEMKDDIKTNGKWLKGVGVSILGSMLVLAGYLVITGGFARQTDIHEIKLGIVELKSKIQSVADIQIQFEGVYNSVSGGNNIMLKRMNGKDNGR